MNNSETATGPANVRISLALRFINTCLPVIKTHRLKHDEPGIPVNCTFNDLQYYMANPATSFPGGLFGCPGLYRATVGIPKGVPFLIDSYARRGNPSIPGHSSVGHTVLSFSREYSLDALPETSKAANDC